MCGFFGGGAGLDASTAAFNPGFFGGGAGLGPLFAGGGGEVTSEFERCFGTLLGGGLLLLALSSRRFSVLRDMPAANG